MTLPPCFSQRRKKQAKVDVLSCPAASWVKQAQAGTFLVGDGPDRVP
jgi:hypothetical protein